MKSLIWFFVALMTAGMLPFDSAVASVEEQHQCQVQGILECRHNTVSEWEYDKCVEQVRASCRGYAPSTSPSSPSSSLETSGEIPFSLALIGGLIAFLIFIGVAVIISVKDIYAQQGGIIATIKYTYARKGEVIAIIKSSSSRKKAEFIVGFVILLPIFVLIAVLIASIVIYGVIAIVQF